MLEVLKAIALGIIQGLTEFLPVSSSGHLKIFSEVLHFQDSSIAFDVLLHLGTLIAICIFYFRDIVGLIVEFFMLIRDLFSFGKYKIFDGERPRRILLIMIIITSIPTAIAGLLLEEIIDTAFSSLILVGIALLITSTLMSIIDKLPQGKKKAGQITVGNALTVGLIQSAAIIPGISRSGSTIFAGRLCGFDTALCVKYSFLCSLPAVAGAAILKIGDLFAETLSSIQITSYILGFVASAIVGYFALRLLNMMAKRRNFKPFAYYCAAAGAFSIIYGIIALF